MRPIRREWLSTNERTTVTRPSRTERRAASAAALAGFCWNGGVTGSGVAGSGVAEGGGLRIFISYRRTDAAAYAGRLHDDLMDHFGDGRVFIDIEAIELGADFEQTIVGTIEGADVVLAVVGPSWLGATDDRGQRRIDQDDDFVRRELEIALDRGVKVVPVLVQDARMPEPSELPASLASFSRRQAFVMSDRRWRAEVAELIRSLERPTAPTIEPSSDAGPPPVPLAPQPRTAPRPPRGTLPLHRTRFIGRAADVARVHELLGATGFVTIVGTGGVGKSRLAIEAARAIEAEYDDGICLAELAALDEPTLVVQAVAGATGVDQRDRDLTSSTLAERLAERRLLLILDNCEHLIDEVAAVAETLVRHCPMLHLLATSRETLQVDGEAVLHLDPLSVPDTGDSVSVADLRESPAAMLFADRAALAAPGFELDDRTAPGVARIAAALDGLPLALELAGASLRHLGLDDVIDGLAGRFGVEGAQRRTSDARQRTLWATVDWSYQLLAEPERILLERLGVFAGSFTSADAGSICGDGMHTAEVPSLLVGLVERSLVDTVDADGHSGRFRLLYGVREYARERLRSRAGDPTPARLQAWATEVAQTHGRAVDVGDELPALLALDLEHANLLAALTLALEAADGATACRIATGLAPYWEVRGLRAEGAKWVAAALDLAPTEDAVRAAALLAASRLATTADFDHRRRLSADALAAADRVGHDALASAALASLGHIEFETDQRDAARRYIHAALARAEAANDDASIALASLRLALCEQGDGDAGERERMIGRAIELYTRLGNRRGQLWCLAELGFAHLVAGDLTPAGEAFEHGLALARELGYAHGEAWMLDALGETAGAAGRFDEARTHFEGAHALQLHLGDQLNRGWSLIGLVRALVRTGRLDEAFDRLHQLTDYMTGDVAPLYSYALLLRIGSAAMAVGDADHVAQVLGALDGLEAPPSLSAADLDDRRALVEFVDATLTPDISASARARGRGVPPVELARRLLDAGLRR